MKTLFSLSMAFAGCIIIILISEPIFSQIENKEQRTVYESTFCFCGGWIWGGLSSKIWPHK